MLIIVDSLHLRDERPKEIRYESEQAGFISCMHCSV